VLSQGTCPRDENSFRPLRKGRIIVSLVLTMSGEALQLKNPHMAEILACYRTTSVSCKFLNCDDIFKKGVNVMLFSSVVLIMIICHVYFPIHELMLLLISFLKNGIWTVQCRS